MSDRKPDSGEYRPEFPELESKVHVMIENLHNDLPVAIDELTKAYDELVEDLRSQLSALNRV